MWGNELTATVYGPTRHDGRFQFMVLLYRQDYQPNIYWIDHKDNPTPRQAITKALQEWASDGEP